MRFTENLHSPIVTAYRNFLKSWNPEAETNNPLGCWGLVRNIQNQALPFVLSGHPDQRLHDDLEFKVKWETEYVNGISDADEPRTCSMCSYQEM